MADSIKIDFSYCDVSIEKMFDIHDNGTVNVFTNTQKSGNPGNTNGNAYHPDIINHKNDLCIALNSEQRKKLQAAEAVGIIQYNSERKGYDTAHQSSNALVAYLCGRLFCGDRTDKDGRWISGSRFDDAQYCKELFGFDVAGTRRSTQYNGAGKSPKGYERVDNLFE